MLFLQRARDERRPSSLAEGRYARGIHEDQATAATAVIIGTCEKKIVEQNVAEAFANTAALGGQTFGLILDTCALRTAV